MEAESKPVVDKLTQTIGGFGRWQFFLVLLLAVPVKVSGICALLGIIFLAPKTQFVCVERLNSTGGIANGTCYSDCVKYEYVTDFENTIISEWDLVCKRAWLVNFTQTVLMFGVLIGSIFFGYVGDRYGRRAALVIASTMQLILSMATPFSPNFWVFTAIRLFLGMSTAGLYAVGFVLVVEIISPSKREIVSSFFHLPYAIGQMILPLFSYYLRSWKKFSLGIGIPNLLFLLFWFYVPESPKWLISTGRLEEASKIMKRAAKINKRPEQDTLEVAKSIHKENNTQRDKSQETKLSYFVLVTHPTLRLRNLCSCFAWFVLGISLYGGNQYIGQTSENVFLSIMLAGAFQVPGMLSSGYLYKRFGRKPTVVCFFLACALFNSILALKDEWFYLKLFSSAMAICCAVSAFTIMYTFTTELFPTLARNMAMGASSTASRVGSMVAPFIAGLQQAFWLPPVIFTVLPLLAAGMCCLLPETKGKILADTLEEEQKAQEKMDDRKL